MSQISKITSSGGGGGGDVTGPNSSIPNDIAVFADNTGKVIADSGVNIADVVLGPATATDAAIPLYNGTTGKLLRDGLYKVDVTNGIGWIERTVAGNPVYISAIDAVTSTPVGSFVQIARSLGTVSAGFGNTNEIDLQNDIGLFAPAYQQQTTWIDATDGSTTSQVQEYIANAGGLALTRTVIPSQNRYEIALRTNGTQKSITIVPSTPFTVFDVYDYIGVPTTTLGASTINLPVSPVNGQEYYIFDTTNDAAANNITIDGQGNNIKDSTGTSAGTLVINTNNGGVTLFFNSSQNIWYQKQ